MAILPLVPGIEVSIQVDGQNLTEYEDDEIDQVPAEANASNAQRVSRYVESVTGKEFSVAMTVTHHYLSTSPSITSEVYIDGKWMNGQVFRVPVAEVYSPKTRITKGSVSYDADRNLATVHHFKFTSLNISVSNGCHYATIC